MFLRYADSKTQGFGRTSSIYLVVVGFGGRVCLELALQWLVFEAWWFFGLLLLIWFWKIKVSYCYSTDACELYLL